MERYSYGKIPSAKEHNSRLVFFKQLFVCSGIWTFYFINGIYTGTTTVIVPQMRRDAPGKISDETVSWLNSLYAFAGTPWIYLSAFLTLHYGKKKTLLMLALSTFVGVMMFYFSSNITHLFISEIILSLISSSQTTIFLPQISEYTSPEYRGVLMTIKSATYFWGIWISNAIGTYFNWRYIALFGLLCSIYPIVSIPFWPESPYWLASQGKLDRCVAAHRWMKGADEGSEQELKKILQSQTISDNFKSVKPSRPSLKSILTVIAAREFYMPIILSILVICVYTASGKMICAVYAVDVMKKITHSESKAYAGMLILDGISVISTYVGCALSKVELKRRFQMIFLSFVVVIFLFTISLYLYLVKLSVLADNAYVSISLLTAFSMAVCCGPMVMCSTLIGELLPLNNRILAICVISTFERLSQGVVYKFALAIFNKFDLDVIFFSFGVSSLFFIALLYVYLPETKDKTLQEIADLIKGRDICSTMESSIIELEDEEQKAC